MVVLIPLYSPTLASRLWVLAVLCTALCPVVTQAAAVPSEGTPEAIESWQPQAGDQFVADTMNNMGYLIHEDGTYVEFKIVTGQRKMVHYVGNTYFAATPIKKWNVTDKEVQTDRFTFGPRGLFLRMNNSHYGIHPTKYGDDLLSKMPEDRFRSFGCIVVSEGMFDMIASTYEENGNELAVTTVYGFKEGYASSKTLANAVR